MDRRQSAAAREGPRAAKEALCIRPYLALQAPSLAARKRCYYKKACIEAGPDTRPKGCGSYPSQAGSHEGRAEHKRLLCLQGSAATIRPAMQIISCQTDSGA